MGHVILFIVKTIPEELQTSYFMDMIRKYQGIFRHNTGCYGNLVAMATVQNYAVFFKKIVISSNWKFKRDPFSVKMECNTIRVFLQPFLSHFLILES